jgi:hypothetical protein
MTPPTNQSKIAVKPPVAPRVLLPISFIATSSFLKLREAYDIFWSCNFFNFEIVIVRLLSLFEKFECGSTILKAP